MRNQVIGLVIGLVLGVTISYLFFQNGFAIPKLSTTQISSLPVNLAQKNAVDLPIPIDDPAVKLVGVTYSLSGQVNQLNPVKGVGNESELVLEGIGGRSQINNLLFISNQTQVTSAASTSATLKTNNLKAGDKINLNFFYDLVKKKGYVTSVQIIQ